MTHEQVASRAGVEALRDPKSMRRETGRMIYVGIDLGKRQYSVCFLDQAGQVVARLLRVTHTGSGLRQLRAQLDGLVGPKQVSMEASGAHWMGLAR